MHEITAAVLRDGRIVEHLSFDFGGSGSADPVWIELHNPSIAEISALRDRFSLHRLAVEDSIRSDHEPKVDVYGDQIFVVAKLAQLEPDAITYEEVRMFVSRKWIVTVRHSNSATHTHAHEDFLKGPAGEKLRPDYVLHGILDYVVRQYFPIVQMVEDEVLAMEKHLQDSFLGRDEITKLLRLRREAIKFQHVVTRMSDVCGKLSNLEMPCIGSTARPYFRDVHDRLARLNGMVGGLLGVILAVFETSSLLEQQRQGVITRQLAAWAAILGVPAAIVGLHGLVDTALFPPWYVYSVVAAMLGICSLLFWRFKRLRWL